MIGNGITNIFIDNSASIIIIKFLVAKPFTLNKEKNSPSKLIIKVFLSTHIVQHVSDTFFLLKSATSGSCFRDYFTYLCIYLNKINVKIVSRGILIEDNKII